MCIIIYKKEGLKVDKEILKRCFKRNSDGAGIAWKEGKNPWVFKKGIMTWEEFEDYNKNLKEEKITKVIHFRIRTHGDKDEKNTHPFLITPVKGVKNIENPLTGVLKVNQALLVRSLP